MPSKSAIEENKSRSVSVMQSPWRTSRISSASSSRTSRSFSRRRATCFCSWRKCWTRMRCARSRPRPTFWPPDKRSCTRWKRRATTSRWTRSCSISRRTLGCFRPPRIRPHSYSHSNWPPSNSSNYSRSTRRSPPRSPVCRTIRTTWTQSSTANRWHRYISNNRSSKHSSLATNNNHNNRYRSAVNDRWIALRLRWPSHRTCRNNTTASYRTTRPRWPPTLRLYQVSFWDQFRSV